jgi:hypothetical protein
MSYHNNVYIGPYIKVYGDHNYDCDDIFFTPEYIVKNGGETIYLVDSDEHYIEDYDEDTLFVKDLANLDSDLILLRFKRKYTKELNKLQESCENKIEIFYGIVYYTN